MASRLGKPALFALCTVPLALLAAEAFTGGLGANPVEYLTHATGDWTLRLLIVTLAVTPLRRITGWNGAVRYRRMLGLFAFFYLSLHFAIYAVLDNSLDPALIVEDVIERPYVTVGFTALLMLLPLAATSTDGMVRRLGGRRWRALHKLAYAATLAGGVHYLWLVKADVTEPLVYLAVTAVLLTLRIPAVSGRLGTWRRSRPARQAGADLGTSVRRPASTP